MTASILVGAVLTFASVDGKTLQLSIALSEPASVSLSWGDLVRTASVSSIHHFIGLPAPIEAPVEYSLGVASEEPRRVKVDPWSKSEPLRVAVYGDSRDGAGPHERLLQQLAAAHPHVLVHTGDVVTTAHDLDGWTSHLSLSLPLSLCVPMIYAVGNHELQGDPETGLARALAHIPPPRDPLAEQHGVAPQSYHVRVGRELFVVLDTNAPLGEGSRGLSFLRAALAERDPSGRSFVVLHHPPLSSGPHGPHPDSDALLRAGDEGGVTAFLAGHDHVYERIHRKGAMVVVTGGGGAPLYSRSRTVDGSKAFASTYHWVLLTLPSSDARIEAFGLEGALLDRAPIPVNPPEAPDGLTGVVLTRLSTGLGFLLFLAGLSVASLHIMRARCATEALPHAAPPQEPLPQEPLPKESLPKESLPKESLPKESLPKESLPKESLPKESLPKESLPKESLPKESLPKEPPSDVA